jgi:hypothetical protein
MCCRCAMFDRPGRRRHHDLSARIRHGERTPAANHGLLPTSSEPPRSVHQRLARTPCRCQSAVNSGAERGIVHSALPSSSSRAPSTVAVDHSARVGSFHHNMFAVATSYIRSHSNMPVTATSHVQELLFSQTDRRLRQVPSELMAQPCHGQGLLGNKTEVSLSITRVETAGIRRPVDLFYFCTTPRTPLCFSIISAAALSRASQSKDSNKVSTRHRRSRSWMLESPSMQRSPALPSARFGLRQLSPRRWYICFDPRGEVSVTVASGITASHHRRITLRLDAQSFTPPCCPSEIAKSCLAVSGRNSFALPDAYLIVPCDRSPVEPDMVSCSLSSRRRVWQTQWPFVSCLANPANAE